jgi:TrpR family transcriptional regulator, trp operon repressor
MKDIKNLTKLIEKLTTDEMKDFLVGILTPNEIEQINKRIEIIKLLKRDMAQHEIAERLGVGVATVSRGAKMLKEKRFKYVKPE